MLFIAPLEAIALPKRLNRDRSHSQMQDLAKGATSQKSLDTQISHDLTFIFVTSIKKNILVTAPDVDTFIMWTQNVSMALFGSPATPIQTDE